jgi:hypothetical protein
VLTLGGSGQGDNGITFDSRANAYSQINVTNNLIQNTNKQAIDFGSTNSTQSNQPGFSNIIVYGNIEFNTPGLLGIGLIDNPGVPVSNFYVTGLGDNAKQVDAIKPDYKNYNSTGIYSNLYLNGVLHIRPPATN